MRDDIAKKQTPVPGRGLCRNCAKKPSTVRLSLQLREKGVGQGQGPLIRSITRAVCDDCATAIFLKLDSDLRWPKP